VTLRRPLILLLLCAAVLGAAGAGSAVAQQDPFGPIPQTPPEQPPPPAPSPTEDQGLNRTQELLIGGAGLVLLFGIGWAIVRDARAAAPVDAEHPVDESTRSKGSRKPPARRVQQGRAKAKAARRARKKNR
jgi:hypothetical protein